MLLSLSPYPPISTNVEKEESGQPDDPGRTFDELHEWNRDAEGVGYWQKGPLSFEIYLQRVFWDQTESKSPTGYVDPDWLRTAIIPTRDQLIGADGYLHRFADHNKEAPPDCELRGIGNADLWQYFGLPTGGMEFVRNSKEHGRARTISGCLRHSGSKVPEDGARPSTYNGLDCGMDSGGWFLIDELLNKINRYVFRSRTLSGVVTQGVGSFGVRWH